VLFGLIVVGLAVLYRYGPSREEAEWRWLTPGSLFAAFAWIAGSLAFSYYLQNFADYNATYGSLGAVIGLMTWMWMSAIVVLAGGEINAEVEHQTARDSTEGGDKPLGTRGAKMADTVGEAKA
jgi:membrane protein